MTTIRMPAASLRMPGRLARDPRFAVTLREDGTPWPIRFYFLHLGDDEDPSLIEWVNVGFEIGDQFDVEPGERHTLDEAPQAVDAVTVQRIAANYATYLEYAKSVLHFDRAAMANATRMLHSGKRVRRELTDDFLRQIAAEYVVRRKAGGHPATEMSKAHHVEVSTASRWIKAARPFIEQEEAKDDA